MKNKYVFSKVRVLIFLFVMIALGVSFMFADTLEAMINPVSGSAAGSFDDVQDGDLQIHYIYSGQADCTAIRLPDDKVMIIDSGEETDGEMVTNYLNSVFFESGENTIDYFIITHTDKDHIGGAKVLLENYDVKTVYRPRVTSKSETAIDGVLNITTNIWDNTVKAMANADSVVTIERDLEIEYTDVNNALNSYVFTFYGPVDDYSDPNDYSPIMLLENAGKKYMFTGDASEEVEKDFLAVYTNHADFDVDVLKAGHHGSNTSSCEEFLAVVKPEYTIISCGIDNKYGHPHNEVITSLESIQSQILRTDVSDSILIYNRGGEIKYVADFFEPASYHIEWWYVAAGIAGITVVVCFYPKSKVKSMAKKAVKNSHKNY